MHGCKGLCFGCALHTHNLLSPPPPPYENPFAPNVQVQIIIFHIHNKIKYKILLTLEAMISPKFRGVIIFALGACMVMISF